MQNYNTYTEVPWYRRSSINSLFVLVGIFFPPLLWLVCILLVTGKVYYSKPDAQGNLKAWSSANKVAAFIFLFAQLVFFAFKYLL